MQTPRSLVRCIRCERHVRADDVSCPFCDAPSTLPRSLLAVAVIAGAAAAAGAMGCGGYGPPPSRSIDNGDPPATSDSAEPAAPSSSAATDPGAPPVGAYGPPPH